jgi:ElaB/YqjD/DUF883 family membrane-anchored ribosome-binding protein
MAQDSRTARASAAAHSLADDALERVRDLRSGMQDYTSRGLSAMGDSASLARDRLSNYANATGRYVSEQPVKTALIAAAIGAAVAAIVLIARNRRDRYYY